MPNKARIDKELNEETERIGEVYSRWGEDISGQRADGTAYSMKPRHAFKFSTDFRFIVPDDGKPQSATSITGINSWTNCLVAPNQGIIWNNGTIGALAGQ